MATVRRVADDRDGSDRARSSGAPARASRDAAPAGNARGIPVTTTPARSRGNGIGPERRRRGRRGCLERDVSVRAAPHAARLDGVVKSASDGRPGPVRRDDLVDHADLDGLQIGRAHV